MEETLIKLRILAGAEMTLARIRARRLARHGAFYAIAVGMLLLALVMVNIGAYQLLTETYTESAAAFILAGGNALLAVLLIFGTYSVRPGPEEAMAREIRDMALNELAADADALKDDFSRLGADVKRIRTGFSILSHGKSIGAGIAGLAPVISILMEMVKRRREKKAAADDA